MSVFKAFVRGFKAGIAKKRNRPWREDAGDFFTVAVFLLIWGLLDWALGLHTSLLAMAGAAFVGGIVFTVISVARGEVA